MSGIDDFFNNVGNRLGIKEIVQVNATVIAGLLIFLSISNLYPSDTHLPYPIGYSTGNSTVDFANNYYIAAAVLRDEADAALNTTKNAYFVLRTSIAFLASSVIALLGSEKYAILAMIAGFVILPASFIHLIIENNEYALKKAQEANQAVAEGKRILGLE